MDIPKGMIVGIIGPSGSGKSTVLRALNRLWEPPSGTVFLDGHDVKDLDVLGHRRKVGMLFQLPALFDG
jgi:ABC-type bacteriocin/lantibiotic exporter with double-glycine peptidase domain